MTETVKTALFAAAAVVLVLAASLSSPGAVEHTFFDDVGEPFFADFASPEQATNLEVWEFVADTGEAVPFNVKQVDGKWTIPSHYDYPADGKDRMAKSAGLLVGLTKAAVRSDVKADWASFGVVDPTEASLELEGRGKRVTFRDNGGSVLADLIIGNEVEEGSGVHYVRIPEKKRIYEAKIDADLSTSFEDWIERDLMSLTSWDVTKIVYDNYSVDESRGELVEGEKVVLDKSGNDWVLADIADDKETDQDAARNAAQAICDLEIVGVRPKPEGLTAQLERAQGIELQLLAQALRSKGYFLARDKLYSNEGDLLVHSKKGVVYELKFGEVVFGTGSAVTSGQETSGRKRITEVEDASAEGEEEGSHRYLMITATFDQSLLEQPEGTPLLEEQLEKRQTARNDIQEILDAIKSYQEANEGATPAALADLTTGEAPALSEIRQDPWENDYVLEQNGDDFRVVSYGADGAADGEGDGEDVASDAFDREGELRTIANDHKRFRDQIEEGEKAAADLTARFGPWYYVIDDESFQSLRLKADQLAVEKGAEEEAPQAPELGNFPIGDPNR